MSKYPEAYSDVTVTFMDGEVKHYHINAGAGIGRYLASEAAANGFLSLFNSKTGESWAIPVTNIRDWSLREVYRESVAETPAPAPVAVETAKPSYVSIRDAVVAVMRANPDKWVTPAQFRPYVEQLCPDVKVQHGTYVALSALFKQGHVDKLGKGYKLKRKGFNLAV